MKPVERENRLYSTWKRCKIELEEEAMMGLLEAADQKENLLDLGSGSGEIAQRIKDLGFKPFCLDFAQPALKIAHNEFGLNSVLHDLDHGKLPFQDEAFGMVWAGDIIEHLFDPLFVLGEVYRVLKKGGKLFITIPNDLYISNRIKILLGESYQYGSYQKFSQFKHHTFFSHKLLKYMLVNNNLRITKRINICKLPKVKKLIKFKGCGLITDLFSVSMIYKIIKD